MFYLALEIDEVCLLLSSWRANLLLLLGTQLVTSIEGRGSIHSNGGGLLRCSRGGVLCRLYLLKVPLVQCATSSLAWHQMDQRQTSSTAHTLMASKRSQKQILMWPQVWHSKQKHERPVTTKQKHELTCLLGPIIGQHIVIFFLFPCTARTVVGDLVMPATPCLGLPHEAPPTLSCLKLWQLSHRMYRSCERLGKLTRNWIHDLRWLVREGSLPHHGLLRLDTSEQT